MGGVDLCDMFHALYRINRRSKKYYTRIVYYLIAVAISNAWLIYKKNNPDELMPLRVFQTSLSLSMMNCHIIPPAAPARGRRSRSRELESSLNSTINDIENQVCFYKLD